MTDHRPSLSTTKGFTLIELLVVISVIAILAAILFPVFARVREQGRKTACLSNEHQLGLAIMQYVQDYDELYPNGVQETATSYIWEGEGWAGQCEPYLHTTPVLACPDDPTVASFQNQVVSYGYNINLIQPGYPYENGFSGLSESVVTSPSRTVLLFEVEDVTSDLAAPLEGSQSPTRIGRNLSASGNGLDNRLYGQTNATTSIQNQYATGFLGGRAPFNPAATQFFKSGGRHTGGSNFLLDDGHAKWLRGSTVSSGLESPLPSCYQDNVPPIAGCTGQFQAAGSDTIDTTFQATFSTT